jgi:hypothetical protein
MNITNCRVEEKSWWQHHPSRHLRVAIQPIRVAVCKKSHELFHIRTIGRLMTSTTALPYIGGHTNCLQSCEVHSHRTPLLWRRRRDRQHLKGSDRDWAPSRQHERRRRSIPESGTEASRMWLERIGTVSYQKIKLVQWALKRAGLVCPTTPSPNYPSSDDCWSLLVGQDQPLPHSSRLALSFRLARVITNVLRVYINLLVRK